MDYVLAGMILGFVLIVFAILWNQLVAPKNKVKQLNAIMQHFVDRYGFTKNEDCTLVSGMMNNRNVQISSNPLQALVQVPNPRGIHILVEKGMSTELMDLIETPIDGATGLTIKSNYPQLACMMLDDKLTLDMKSLKYFSYQLSDGLVVRFPASADQREVHRILKTAISFAQAIEQVNYAYGG